MAAAIYSALVGNYERPGEHILTVDLGVDQIMFTDNPDAFRGSKWIIVPVSRRFPTDTVRSARYLKTVGHEALSGYDRTIWVDNRVALKPEGLELFGELDDCDLVIPKHSYRANIRDEYEEVIASRYDDPARVRATYQMALAAGVDMSAPALWTGLMARRRNDRVDECMRLWMDYILVGSRRDQLSLHAALATVMINTKILDLDNKSSTLHEWSPTNGLERNRSIQAWRPPARTFKIRISDLIRSRETTRRGARLLQRAGHPLPTLEPLSSPETPTGRAVPEVGVES